MISESYTYNISMPPAPHRFESVPLKTIRSCDAPRLTDLSDESSCIIVYEKQKQTGATSLARVVAKPWFVVRFAVTASAPGAAA